MAARKTLVFMVVMGLLGAPPAAIGQASDELAMGMWASVKKLPLGAEVVVRLKDGAKLKGRLSGFSDAGLTLERKRQSVSVEREQVLQVYRRVPKSPALHTLVGAAVGFGAFAAGHAAAFPDEPAPTHAADGPLILLSAGVGALVGTASAAFERRNGC